MSESASATRKNGTPMLKQYAEIKDRYPGHVLFYRMGDFYEMFFEDAHTAHKVLGIVITSRGQQGGEDVPLAGFPYHQLEPQLEKMVRAGYRVAICEQVEDPRKAKGLVKRDVVEVVTAGTNFTAAVTANSANNFLAALCVTQKGYGLAWADVTTGEFNTGEFSSRDLNLMLASLEPAEILVSRSQQQQLKPICAKAVVTRIEDWFFDAGTARRDLLEHFGVHSLRGFGIEDEPGAVASCGALLGYLRENLRRDPVHMAGIRRHDLSNNLLLDPSTRRNLELVHSLSGDGPTLLSVLDHTLTPMGRRLLIARLWTLPSVLSEIHERQQAVRELVDDGDTRNRLHDPLTRIGDLERIVARLAAGKANGRDLRVLAAALSEIPGLRDTLSDKESGRLIELREALDPLPDTLCRIQQTIVAEPPLAINQGGLIRDGVSARLDELREIIATGKDWLKRFEERERERTGISSLKIKYNRVFGYHIEVSRSNLDRVPESYIRRQTLANAERFITEDLKEHEDKVLHAEEHICELEQELFWELVQEMIPHFTVLQRNAARLAELDLLLCLATVAVRQNWCEPQVVDDGELHLTEARHPVIEQVLPAGESFIPNDVVLSSEREQLMLLTGPNMAGKSTYLRMVGLITLLAHMGSFVPAAVARIPLRDQIFTRVGASDNLARGESTFLVEMNEAAFILNNATSRSLVLLDEIGRGTSTFDGLSLAWAITEYLHDSRECRPLTLFATHYHELVDLERSLVRLRNYNIEVRQYGDRVLFTRRVLPGGCSHSYGIDVARMAGLPGTVIQRAREVLGQLEAHEYSADLTPTLQQVPRVAESAPAQQLTLFSSPDQDLRRKLREADVEQMTPLQAMQLLIELKHSLDG